MKKITILLLFIFFFINCKSNNIKLPNTIDDLIKMHPKRLKKLFNYYNLEYPGFKNVKIAIEQNNYKKASIELLKYYENSKITKLFNNKFQYFTSIKDFSVIDNMVLNDVVSRQGVTGKIKRLKNGLIDWKYRGPKNDKEWAFLQNRHDFLLNLFYAFNSSKNEKYVIFFDKTIKDWIIQNPKKILKTNSVQWRVTEAGKRILENWPLLFYLFQHSKNFTPASRLMMLMMIPDHAKYIMKYHSKNDNHAIIEMCGLVSTAVYWPEFKNSKKWFNYATKSILNEIQNQIYPDGAYKELSVHYHKNIFLYLKRLDEIIKDSDKELPKLIEEKIITMLIYLSAIIKPNGYGINNNDSDLEYLKNLISENADYYKRSDLKYITTNGQKGILPEYTSIFFPYAGQMIMRDNWTIESNWAYFNVGPWGTGGYWFARSHQHDDKLHLSISAFGKDILVDSGRYIYSKNNPFRKYFVNSESHNVILIDGKGQNNRKKEIKNPLKDIFIINDEYDFAIGSFNNGFKNIKAKHTRAVFYKKKKYWLVADNIKTKGLKLLGILWHFHPNCIVKIEGKNVLTKNNEEGNLIIIPIGLENLNLEIISGQTTPIQGWWSDKYNNKIESNTAIYKSNTHQNKSFAWLIIPFKTKLPKIEYNLIKSSENEIRIKIKIDDDISIVDIFFNGPKFLFLD